MAAEMVVNRINNELAQLDKDVGTINSWVNHYHAEIDESCSQAKVTDGLLSDMVRCLEVLEERDMLRNGQLSPGGGGVVEGRGLEQGGQGEGS